MSRDTLFRVLFTGLVALVVLGAFQLGASDVIYVTIACIACTAVCIVLYRFDYLHPATAYIVPWLFILLFSIIPISSHARPINGTTYGVLLANLIVWMFACVGAQPRAVGLAPPGTKGSLRVTTDDLRTGAPKLMMGAFAALYVFAALNVLMAGYVPLISLVTTGDSRYADFGVPSVYGAFLAYANALACAAFYIYERSRNRKYLFLFFSVLVMHLLFVTRQNIVTLLIEAFVIRCFVTRRLSGVTLAVSVSVALLGFSALGNLRGGNINEIIGVRPEYEWIPAPVIWVYAYSYFNALNIDNMITTSGAPFFDGFMWQTLLPSIFRSKVDHLAFVELAAMNVSSYVFPVYMDIGRGVLLWTFILGVITTLVYRRAVVRVRFVDVASYACLFFCAFLSFFVNFWLYLPVIFQLFFFWTLQILVFRSEPRKVAGDQLNFMEVAR